MMNDVTPFPNASTPGDGAQSSAAGRGGCSEMVPTHHLALKGSITASTQCEF